MRRRAVLAGLAAAAGCAVPTADGEGTAPTELTGNPLGLTYGRPSGNRIAPGQGSLDSADVVDVELPTAPDWLVGVTAGDRSLWAATLGEEVRGIELLGGEAASVDIPGDDSGPPALLGGEDPRLLEAENVSGASHPIPVPGGVAYVDGEGGLVLDGEADAKLSVDALPDARLVTDGSRLYAFAEATRRYAHGVLGDDIEAGGVAVVDPGAGELLAMVRPSGKGVFEGTTPLLADITGDGRPELVLTVSDAERGARVSVFDREGGLLAEGPGFDGGFRWRHQLAVAPFGPKGSGELAVCRTPHIGGVLEFYRPDGTDLRVVAERGGYSTHRIGSRNLDAARAGRFGSDGGWRLLVPTTARDELAALRRLEWTVRETFRLPVGGTLTTNLAAVAVGGRTVLGAGHEGGIRFWVP